MKSSHRRDPLTKRQRSAHMAKIRGRGTKPEVLARRLLRRLGIRYRSYDAHLPGRPDFVVRVSKTVIFIHGCFWHRHAACGAARREPRSNVAFWRAKFRANVARDRRVAHQLRVLGWRVLVVWECAFRDPERLERRLAKEFTPS